MLRLQDVHRRYRSGKVFIHALRGVSLEVREGDFTVIKGPSGSGKSTLLNILGLLDAPDEGAVYLDGTAVTYDDFDALAVTRARIVSFIFQAFNLNPVLTLEENVMVPLMIRPDIPRHEKKARVAEWIDKVGLSDHRTHRPDELSGGQRQRVAIARAMVTHPQLVIADEPTANLDSTTTRTILALMQALNAEQKVAFVFATHDPLLEQYAKSRYLLTDGVLSAAG
jgi:putative ABC transport system ATP-binding protein